MDSFQNEKKLYGLIGYPLGHSFSMEYFNEKFESENINAEYMNFEIEDIGDLMEVIAEYPNLCGLNVTYPYKEQVLPYLTSIDDAAKSIGAVNVIKITRGPKDNDVELRGYNSDTIGFMKSVEPFVNENRKKAMMLGTGGASKAVTYALRKLGIEVMLVSRQKSAATHTYDELTKAMVNEHKIIVNATPLGMFPHTDTCPDFPYRFGQEPFVLRFDIQPRHHIIYAKIKGGWRRSEKRAGNASPSSLRSLRYLDEITPTHL